MKTEILEKIKTLKRRPRYLFFVSRANFRYLKEISEEMPDQFLNAISWKHEVALVRLKADRIRKILEITQDKPKDPEWKESCRSARAITAEQIRHRFMFENYNMNLDEFLWFMNLQEYRDDVLGAQFRLTIS